MIPTAEELQEGKDPGRSSKARSKRPVSFLAEEAELDPNSFGELSKDFKKGK